MPFGINWKLVGLVCGVCAAPFTGGTSLIASCAVCGGIGVAAGHFIEQSDKKDKLKKQKLDLKGKSLEEVSKDNKVAQEEEKKLREELENQNKENEKLEKELEQARGKLNDSSLSKEERGRWRRKVVALEEQLSSGKNNSLNLSSQLKKIGERIKNNNKVISGVGLNTEDSNWIQDLFTLENILIVVGVYVVYRIMKDDK